MLRKTILGLAAAAAVATTVLAPTVASAHYYGHGHGYRSHYKVYNYYQPSCWTKKVWDGYYGYRYVRVCN